MGKGLGHKAAAAASVADNKKRHAGKGQLAPAQTSAGSADDMSNQGGTSTCGATEVNHYPPRNSGNPGQN